MDRLNQKIEWLLFNVLPSFFFLAVLGNLVIDARSVSLRAAFLGFSFLLTLWSPQWSVRLLLVCLPWFEIPTLKLGFQNQFVVEVFIIGFLFSFFIYRKKNKLDLIPKDKILHQFVYHPLFLPMLFAVCFGFASFLVQIGELYALSFRGLKFYKVVQLYLRNFLDWNIGRDPFICISLISSYLLHITFLIHIFSFSKELHLHKKDILVCFALGALGVFGYAYLQVFFPAYVSSLYTVDIGGTFQNGNTLSFYVVLCFYIGLQLFNFHKPHFFLSLILLTTGLIPLMVGKGKAAWFACIISFVFVSPLLFKRFFSSLKAAQKKYAVSGLFLGIPLLVVGFYYLQTIPNFSIIQRDFIEGKNTVIASWEQKDIRVLLNSFGRTDHISKSIEFIKEKPFLGHGIGTFFRRSGGFYELHNSYLEWLYSMGLGGFLVTVLALILFLYNFNLRLFFKGKGLSTVWFSFALFLCFFMDHHLSYRPLAYIMSILLGLIVFDSHKKIINNKWFVLLPFLTIFLAFACGVSTVMNPQTSSMMFNRYNAETDPQGDFFWVSFASEEKVPQKHCFEAEIFPYPSSTKDFYFTLGSLKPHPEFYGSFTDLLEWEKNYLNRFKTFFIKRDVWTKICACNTSDKVEEVLYLRGNQISVPYLTSGIKDDRLLSFRMRKNQVISLEKFLEKKETSCEEFQFQ